MGKKRRLVIKTNRGTHNCKISTPYIMRGQGWSLGLPAEYRAKKKAALADNPQNGKDINS